jgi:lysophospholipase L1-like esterase
MLGKDGTPMPELFVRDGLHMTSAGYDIWTDVLANLLQSIH